MLVAAALLAALVGAALAAYYVRRSCLAPGRDAAADARAESQAIRRAAQIDAEAIALASDTEAREAALEERGAVEQELSDRMETLARREERLVQREAAAVQEAASAQTRAEAVQKRESEVQSASDRAKNKLAEVVASETELRAAFERLAGATVGELKQQLAETWIEEARAEAAQRLRFIDQNAGDLGYAREAKRIMGIATQRYEGHYLTERLLSTLAIPPGFAEYLNADDGTMFHALEEGTGVKLEISETAEKLHLDSGDGVAREVARRAIQKLIKGTAPRDVEREPKRWMEQITANLDREIGDLGKKAFGELELPKAHAELVKLVGRLNYRTSYTQNQWKHALEAAFLAGMMAAELGLDVKLARRATLLHDIGKSLTHEIDGSHAVIGADYARRLGETELIANAIGAHHGDEPTGSVIALLVAAADAMSGARPGARREQTENYSTRLEDLERIGNGFRGVERAFAVQGGREVRVYVKEREVNDGRAVTLSSEIAKKISAEMTFPGQIKVTVIRQVEAVEIAS